ncbi:hypothetical protein YC2023_024299 [Brassica napus]
MPIVPGYLTMLENSVNAILSSANRENLPLLYPGPGELLDTTISIFLLTQPRLFIQPTYRYKSAVSTYVANYGWLNENTEHNFYVAPGYCLCGSEK